MMNNTSKIRGQEAKQKLIETAITLIAQNGITALSAKLVADRAQMSKSNLFHHFATVDDLILEAFDFIAVIISQSTSPDPQTLELSLKDLLMSLGHKAFHLEPQEKTVFTALLHYYQLALINPVYKQRIIALKAQATQGLIKTLTNWIHSQSFTLLEKNHFIDQGTRIAETIVMNLDSLGMYHMIETDVAKSMSQWAQSVDYYCTFILGRPQ